MSKSKATTNSTRALNAYNKHVCAYPTNPKFQHFMNPIMALNTILTYWAVVGQRNQDYVIRLARADVPLANVWITLCRLLDVVIFAYSLSVMVWAIGIFHMLLWWGSCLSMFSLCQFLRCVYTPPAWSADVTKGMPFWICHGIIKSRHSWKIYNLT